MIEVLDWFFSTKGKHRNDFVSRAKFADNYATDPSDDLDHQKVTIQPISTWQYRKNPSITIQTGSTKGHRTGLGIAIEHTKASNDLSFLAQRTLNTINIKLLIESSSEQTTNAMTKLVTDIFFVHIPRFYQNVLMMDLGKTQIIFPKDYEQSETLERAYNQESNVERLFSSSMSFNIEYESVNFIEGFAGIGVVNRKGKAIIDSDAPEIFSLGKPLVFTIKTNVGPIKVYATSSGMIHLEQVEGDNPMNTNRIYRATPLQVGKVSFQYVDKHGKVRLTTDHNVVF
jgi:hypothetical protein